MRGLRKVLMSQSPTFPAGLRGGDGHLGKTSRMLVVLVCPMTADGSQRVCGAHVTAIHASLMTEQQVRSSSGWTHASFLDDLLSTGPERRTRAACAREGVQCAPYSVGSIGMVEKVSTR